MTDKMYALGCLVSIECPERTSALAQFYRDAEGDNLVLNKWFSVQASADLPDVLEHVRTLKTHADFVISNPNRARSLISMFAANMSHFHATDGEGYKFIADCVIELDAINGQVAARLATSFTLWRRFDGERQALMRSQLERIQATAKSKDTLEIIARCLK